MIKTMYGVHNDKKVYMIGIHNYFQLTQLEKEEEVYYILDRAEKSLIYKNKVIGYIDDNGNFYCYKYGIEVENMYPVKRINGYITKTFDKVINDNEIVDIKYDICCIHRMKKNKVESRDVVVPVYRCANGERRINIVDLAAQCPWDMRYCYVDLKDGTVINNLAKLVEYGIMSIKV